jgi:uncharacterized protein YneF (UPF0154 family)
MQNQGLKARVEGSLRKLKKPSKKTVLKLTSDALIFAILILVGIVAGYYWGSSSAQTAVWDQIHITENQLRDLYSNSTQTELKAWLPDSQMNFTDGLVWESHLLSYTENRPQYQNVVQVLKNGKGACGEFVWVFGAFCVAKNIPFRMVTVGYFVPNVVDHSWAQVNPFHDGKTWIQVEVTDSCVSLENGKTIGQLWNSTINNNAYYNKNHYKMVLAFQLNENSEVVITDVTSTFSPP